MFVRKSKYKELEREIERRNYHYDYLQRQHEKLLRDNAKNVFDYNELVDEYNALEKKSKQPAQVGFNLDEIKSLIRLCHPDKHNGKQSANDMTVKLLALKKQLGG